MYKSPFSQSWINIVPLTWHFFYPELKLRNTFSIFIKNCSRLISTAESPKNEVIGPNSAGKYLQKENYHFRCGIFGIVGSWLYNDWVLWHIEADSLWGGWRKDVRPTTQNPHQHSEVVKHNSSYTLAHTIVTNTWMVSWGWGDRSEGSGRFLWQTKTW